MKFDSLPLITIGNNQTNVWIHKKYTSQNQGVEFEIKLIHEFLRLDSFPERVNLTMICWKPSATWTLRILEYLAQ